MTTSQTVGVGFCLAVGISLLTTRPLHAANPAEELFRKLGMPSDTASLIEYLRGQSAGEDDLARIDTLVRQLGSGKFKEREQAGRRLVALGTAATPALRRALAQRDIELVRRAKSCIGQIERQISDSHAFLPRAAVRLLIARKAKGAIAALLRYLPFTDDPGLEEEIYYGLNGLAVRGGKVHPALVAGLRDKVAARRAVAACIIGRMGDVGQRRQVRKLLTDKDSGVRLRSTQGLLARKDAAGINALTGLLTDTSLEIAWQAEELLHWVAGESAPRVKVGKGREEMRRECRKAWEQWWQRHQETLDMGKLFESPRRPGLVLVCERSEGPEAGGRVSLYGCNSRIRWQHRSKSVPHQTQLLSEDRIVICEGKDGMEQLVEKALDGQQLWRCNVKSLQMGSAVFQRLTNGRALLYHEDGLSEINSDGETVFSVRGCLRYNKGRNYSYIAAMALQNGNVLCVPEKGEWVIREYDPNTKRFVSEKSFSMGFMGRVQLYSFPNGGLLVHDKNELTEMSEDGNIRRRHLLLGEAYQVESIPDGNVIIVSQHPVSRAYEIDREGRVVWEVLTEGKPTGVRSCLNVLRLGLSSGRQRPYDFNSVPNLCRSLNSQQVQERRKAANLLLEHGRNAKGAENALVDALADSDEAVSQTAGEVFSAIGPPGVPVLIRCLKDARTTIREKAAYLLTPQAATRAVVLAALLDALKDKCWRVRRAAVSSLGGFRSEGETLVPALIKVLDDPKDTLREVAIDALGRLGPSAELAVPALLRQLRSQDKILRLSVINALERIGPGAKLAVPGLLADFRTEDELANQAAIVSALGAIGKDGKQAIPTLIKCVQSNGRIVGEAVTALGKMGPLAVDAVPVLIQILRDKNKELYRYEVVVALGRIGPAARPAIPVLLDLLRDRDAEFVWDVKRAIRGIQGNPVIATPAMGQCKPGRLKEK